MPHRLELLTVEPNADPIGRPHQTYGRAFRRLWQARKPFQVPLAQASIQPKALKPQGRIQRLLSRSWAN